MMTNKAGRKNRYCAFPLNAKQQFGSVACATPVLSAAVAHLPLCLALLTSR